MVLMRGLLPSAMRKITMKKYWCKFHSQKGLKRISNLLAYFILCFILIFFSNSNLIIYYTSSIKEDNGFNQDINPKASDPPVISILSPDNYTLLGTIAPNYSLTITDGIGNYSWYEFLETGEKSVPKELEGILNEDINDTFDQTLWDNLNNGTVTIRFYVNDSLGDVGQADAIIRIDIIDPTINVISPTGGFFNSTSPEFTVEISDPNLDKMWYTLNTDTTKYFFQDNGTINQSAWNSLSDGPVDINFYANDSVANENSVSVQVTKDSVNPAPPMSLSADPSSWTNINNFDLSWTNPSDTSGIVGAYYKLDNIPTSNTDGTYIAGVGIESITGIAVNSNGTHPIYVWLRDAAGNIDYNNYATTQLQLDGEDPNAPNGLIATPSSWTNIDSFNLSWTNPADVSGIVGAYYRLDLAPTSDTDGTYVAGSDIESLIGISVTTDGPHTVYVWLNDTAGNINYNNYATTQLFLDTVKPSSAIGLSATPSSWTNIDSFNLSWTNPSDTSGIVGAYYRLDTAPNSDTDGTYVAGGTSITGISVTTDGSHTVYVWLVDAAGNINYSTYVTTQFYLDTSDPLIPPGLIAIPSSWTNVNYFNVSWTNPTDMSGIVGAYYKLDSAPTSNTDGTYVAGTYIEIITGITVNSNGTHTIYVWLVDAAGNINYNNYNTTLLYLDTIKPTIDDLQDGDDIWRNAGGTTYNVDFIDPNPSSTLDYAQYKITSAQGQDGTILVDWEFIFTDHDSSSYTLDWSIDFDACQEGTNWVSVRVFDDAGNFEELNDTFYVKKDTISPALLINSPQDGSIWSTPPDIHLSATDLNLDSVWYTVGATKILLTNGISEPLNSSIWSNLLGEQEFTIYYYANDTVGNVNNTYSHTLYKDILAPRMIINKPYNLTYYKNPPPINVTVIDPNFASLTYTVIGYLPTNIWLDNNTEEALDQNIWDQLPQGEFQVIFSAFDSLGNRNNLKLTLYKDSLAPNVIVNSPEDLARFNSPPFINVTAYDPNLDTIWYRINTTIVFLTNNEEEMLNTNIWGNLSEGVFYLEIFANDTLNNLNNTYTLTLYKDTIAPDLTINSPQDGMNWKDPPDIQVTSADPYVDSIWYTVGASKVLLTNGISESLNSTIWDNLLGEQEFVIYFFANDTAGNVNNTYFRTLYKDVLAPRIIINKPTNQTYHNSPPPINVTVYDPNFYSLSYTVIGYLPVINLLNNNTEEFLNGEIWDVLPQGEFQVVISALDSLGNGNESQLILYKDTIAPFVIVNSPENQSCHHSPPFINVVAFDPNLDTIWYRFNTTNIELSNGVDQMFNLSIWNNLNEGSFIIEIFANDTFNYLNDSISLTLKKDCIFPNISIVSPFNNTWYSNAPTININVYDVNFDSVWYTVGANKVLLTNGVSEPLDSTIWDSLLGEQEFIIYFFANDSAGNLNDTYYLTLYKDTLAPLVTVNKPQNYTHLNSRPTINVMAFDPNLDSIRYKVGSLSQIIDHNTDQIMSVLMWDSISEGEFILEILAEDSFGHINDSVRLTLYKDTIFPNITINLPKPNDLVGTIAPDFHLTIIESNLNTTWYNLIGNDTNVICAYNTTDKIDQSIWDEFGNGPVVIRFYANDTARNLVYKDLIVRKNIYAPIISVTSPLENDLIGVLAPNFTVYISGVEIDSTWYTLDNGITNYTFTGLTDTINPNAWDNFGYETVTIEFYINDSLGEMGFDEITVRKDPDPPQITVNLPINQTAYSSEPIIHVIVNEPNLHKIWCKVGTQIAFLVNNIEQNLNTSIWDSLPQGSFNLEFYANDTVGNLNNLYNFLLYKDTLGPNITIISPFENENVGKDTPYFEVSIIDANNISSSWYTINGGNTKVFFIGETGKIEQNLWENLWNNLTDGDIITIRFYANDTLGNLDHEDVSVIKYSGVLSNLLEFISSPLGLTLLVLGFGIMLPGSIKLTKSRYYKVLDKKEKSKLKKIVLISFFLLSLIILFNIF